MNSGIEGSAAASPGCLLLPLLLLAGERSDEDAPATQVSATEARRVGEAALLRLLRRPLGDDHGSVAMPPTAGERHLVWLGKGEQSGFQSPGGAAR